MGSWLTEIKWDYQGILPTKIFALLWCTFSPWALYSLMLVTFMVFNSLLLLLHNHCTQSIMVLNMISAIFANIDHPRPQVCLLYFSSNPGQADRSVTMYAWIMSIALVDKTIGLVYLFIRTGFGLSWVLQVNCIWCVETPCIDVDAIGRLFHPPAACSSSGPLAIESAHTRWASDQIMGEVKRMKTTKVLPAQRYFRGHFLADLLIRTLTWV
jgi:hypothetical protein